jgi:hypothetical protein
VGCSSSDAGIDKSKTARYSSNDGVDKTKETGCSCNNYGVNKSERKVVQGMMTVDKRKEARYPSPHSLHINYNLKKIIHRRGALDHFISQ